jgi:hypothetical protein
VRKCLRAKLISKYQVYFNNINRFQITHIKNESNFEMTTFNVDTKMENTNEREKCVIDTITRASNRVFNYISVHFFIISLTK